MHLAFYLANLWRHLTGLPDRCQLVRPTTHLSCVELDRRQRANMSGSTIVDRTVKFCRTHFYVVRERLKSTHVKRWTQSTTNFWLLWTSWEGRSHGCQVDTVPTKSNCYTTTTDADVHCCRRRIDNQVTAFLWYRRRYCKGKGKRKRRFV